MTGSHEVVGSIPISSILRPWNVLDIINRLTGLPPALKLRRTRRLARHVVPIGRRMEPAVARN